MNNLSEMSMLNSSDVLVWGQINSLNHKNLAKSGSFDNINMASSSAQNQQQYRLQQQQTGNSSFQQHQGLQSLV